MRGRKSVHQAIALQWLLALKILCQNIPKDSQPHLMLHVPGHLLGKPEEGGCVREASEKCPGEMRLPVV